MSPLNSSAYQFHGRLITASVSHCCGTIKRKKVKGETTQLREFTVVEVAPSPFSCAATLRLPCSHSNRSSSLYRGVYT